MSIPEPGLEEVYEALADGIDSAGTEKEAMFLAKVCLMLADALGDPDRVLRVIAESQTNMQGMRQPGPGADGG